MVPFIRSTWPLSGMLGIHRAFAEAVAWDDGKLNRLGARRHAPPSSRGFAKKLLKEDVVVIEATAAAASVAAARRAAILRISPIGLQRSTKRAHGELRALRREIARLHAIDRAVEADARGQIAQPNWAPQRLTAIKNPRGLLPLNRNLSVPGFDQGSGKSSERTIELRALSGYAVLMTAKIYSLSREARDGA